MNNLHRELAPISDAAWADLEAEARRTFTAHAAARRAVDVTGPGGPADAAVATGQLESLEPPPGKSLLAYRRSGQLLVELRVPFTVDRSAVDSVERGAKDADWQPVKDAVEEIVFAEDRAVFQGYGQAGIDGVAASSSNAPVALPTDVRELPAAVARAVAALRRAGVDGPYSLVLPSDTYTAAAETTDHGNAIWGHLSRLTRDGQIVWAPALDGAFLLSTRGGDHELHLGQDLSIGYRAHDLDHIQLYLLESFTFLVHTTEASIAMPAG